MKRSLGLVLACVVLIVGCQVNTSEKVIIAEENQMPQVTEVIQESDFDKLMSEFSEDNVLATIKELASEKYDGRYTGDEGNNLAAQYIAKQMKESGLTTFNGDDDYLDPFQLYVYQNEKNPTVELFDKNGEVKQSLVFIEEFYYYTQAMPVLDAKSVPVVYGSQQFAKDVIDNKIILVPWENYYEAKKDDFDGAKAVIYEYRLDGKYVKLDHFIKSVSCTQEITNGEEINHHALLRVDRKSFEALEENSRNGEAVRITANYERVLVDTNNVVGVIEGKNRDEKDDYILVTGHFDHLGNNLNGTYNAGALDNASGISFALEIGRAIKAADLSLDATIVVIGFSGEEIGLYGSKKFVENYSDIFDNAVVFNYDMIGHRNNTDYDLSMISEQYGTVFINEIKAIAKNNKFKLTSSTTRRSDHKSFAEVGIPAVTIIEYDYSEYHSYKDTADKIDKNDYPILAKMLFEYIVQDDQRGE